MDDSETRTLAEKMIERAIDYSIGPLARHRDKGWRYYNGRVDQGVELDKQGNPKRSAIVVREVQDTVDTVLPEAIKPFISGQEIGEFQISPGLQGPEAAQMDQQAQQETEFANMVFFEMNDGFGNVHDAMQEGLIGGYTVASVYWRDEIQEPQVDDFSGWTWEQVQSEHMKPGQRCIKVKPMEEPDSTGMILYEGKRERERDESYICVEIGASEELLIDGDVQDVEEARVIGTYCRRTVSDIMAMDIPGVELDDVLKHARSYKADDSQLKRTEIERTEGRIAAGTQTSVSALANHWVQIAQCQLLIDRDGDGICERYDAIGLGETKTVDVVYIEPTEEMPKEIIWSPHRRAHSPIGDGLSHKLIDLQEFHTGVMRRAMDSLSATTQCDIEIADDFSGDNVAVARTQAFGRVFATRNPGSIRAVDRPFVGDACMAMSQWADQRRILRTNVSPASQGLDPDALKGQTEETGAAIIGAQKSRPEYYARCFGEDFIKPIFERICELGRRHVQRPVYLKIRGDYQPVDISRWASQLEYRTKVGLGYGTQSERALMLNAVLMKQEQILGQLGLANPWATPETYQETLVEWAETIGAANGERYFPKPSPQALQAYQQQMAAKSAQPTDEDKKAQADMAKAQMDNQAKLQQTAMQERGKLVQLRSREISRDQDREDQQRHAIEMEGVKLAADLTKMDREGEWERELKGDDVQGTM